MAEKEKKVFDRTKPHVNIGGIGHVDHGKTTLIASITKHLASKGQAKFKDYGEIDKAPEERKRGITISTSHIEFETPNRHYTWIDCPGHADYIKNMITGASQMDGAILILSAEDGAMNQTEEHLLLAKQIGIKHLVVFINKIDVVSDAEQIELVKEDIKNKLDIIGYDAENTPIIGGSALCALEGRNPEIGEQTIAKLLEAIDNYIPTPDRDEKANFLMPIEDVFSISGRGTVVTGKVEQGKLRKGEAVEISGLGIDSIKTVAVSIEMHNKELDEARAGDSVGINVRNVKKEQVSRGQTLTKPSETGKIQVRDKFAARAYILTKEERGRHTGFKSGYRPQFYFGATDVTGTITLTNKEAVVEPGSTVDFTVELAKPVAIEAKKNFVIREGNHTIGQGTIIELL